MAKCSSCGTDLSDKVRFCSSCGIPVSNTDDSATLDFATSSSPVPPRPPSKSSSRPPSSAEYLLNEGRFLPGRLLASRYRVIALLGKGGMGEVYRADDLTLGQAVAMKFLPDEAGRDEGLLERFRNEVRMARRAFAPHRVPRCGGGAGERPPILPPASWRRGEPASLLWRRRAPPPRQGTGG